MWILREGQLNRHTNGFFILYEILRFTARFTFTTKESRLFTRAAFVVVVPA